VRTSSQERGDESPLGSDRGRAFPVDFRGSNASGLHSVEAGDLFDAGDAVDDELLAQLASNMITVDHHGRDAQLGVSSENALAKSFVSSAVPRKWSVPGDLGRVGAEAGQAAFKVVRVERDDVVSDPLTDVATSASNAP
jgi:hypothetical protein